MRGRWIIVVLALAAAAAFAISVQTGRWWSVGEITVGPLGARACFEDQCREAYVGGTARWLRTGIALWASGMITMFVLTVLAAGVASKRVPRLAAKTALVSLGTALAVSGLWVAQFPGIPGSTMGRGIYLFAGALVAGAVAAVIVLRAKVPAPT